jgi:hypothetical protein
MAVEITHKHERAVVIILAVLCLITWSAVAINQKDKTASLGRNLTTRVVHISGGQVKFEASQPITGTAPSIQNAGNQANKAFSE